MGKQNFIKTTDEDTYETLLRENFTFLGKENGVYVFLNNSVLTFSEQPHNMIYTNIACL